MSEFDNVTKNKVPFCRSPLLETPGITHGFWGRRSGVGDGLLNVGRYKDDADSVVFANRQTIVDQMGGGSLCLVKQVHGTKVLFIDKPMNGEVEGDGLVTRTPGLILGVMTADCLPLLMFHPRSQTIAAVHAGWRGVVGGIALEALKVMDVKAEEVLVAIGPCIWQVSYTVGQDVYDQAQEPGCFLLHPHEEGKYLYDVAGHMLLQLQRAGVKRISPSCANTYALSDYFSFRRKTHVDEQAGNQLSAIALVQ